MIEAVYASDVGVPEYVRATRKLHQMLAKMQIGDRLSPERRLCVDLGVSRVTLRRALEFFRREGLLGARQGRGTWLARAVPALPSHTPAEKKFLGLVVPSVQQPLISRVVQGAEQYTADHGFHIALAHDHGDKDYQIQQLRRMAESEVSGLAVIPDAVNLQRQEFLSVLRDIKEARTPLVMIDRYAPEIASCSVLSDNYQGSYIATQHLILTGHRRLGLLAFGPEGGVADRDRRRGFLAALENYGMAPQLVRQVDLGTEDYETPAREAVRQWLAQRSSSLPFDGLVCMQDNMAYGAYLALREAGIRVPDDVALVGYDNLDRELFRAAGLGLTSIDQPAEKIGAEAMRLLISLIEARELEAGESHLLLKPSLVVRSSCGSGVASAALVG